MDREFRKCIMEAITDLQKVLNMHGVVPFVTIEQIKKIVNELEGILE